MRILNYIKGYYLVPWPECQKLMDLKDFRKNSMLINGLEGLDKYGSSTYVVDSDWLASNPELSENDDDEDDLQYIYDEELYDLGLL